MRLKVKICGITNMADADAAVQAGADLLGFVFYEKSPRHVSMETAAEICRAVPAEVQRVGLFVNAEPDFVIEASQRCQLQLLQFHGEESPEYCRQFRAKTMKAFRVKGPETLMQMEPYQTDFWLLDAFVPGKPGGTGQTFDWQLAAQAVGADRPVFLAGGLTPDNVADAVRTVRPYGVDVSGGVEAKPGRKDHDKVRAFIQSARQAAKSMG